jgi:hypothetical protein
MPVDKLARTRSIDPRQEHLRERKSKWNKECSEFIARINAFKPHLISFKRGLNGRGDAKAGLPISNIKDPLPSDIGAYLSGTSSEFGELVSTFSGLASEANSIIQEQAEYSAHRRKPQEHGTQSIAHAMDESDLDDALMIEGSSALSRFWSNMSSRWLSPEPKEVRLYRLSMLRAARDLFKDLVELEDAVLEKGLTNVDEIFDLYTTISNDMRALRLSFNAFAKFKTDGKVPPTDAAPPADVAPVDKPAKPSKSVKPVESKPAQEVVPEPPPPAPITKSISDYGLSPIEGDTPLDVLKNNLMIMSNAGQKDFGFKDVHPFLKIYNDRKKKENESKRSLMEARLRDLYEEIHEEFVKLHKQASISDDELIALARSSSISRLMKRVKNMITPADAAYAARSEAFDIIRATKKSVDEIMDLLEEHEPDVENLKDKMVKVEERIIHLISPLKILFTLYKKYYRDNGSSKKRVFDPADRYFTKQIRRDVDQPGW